MAKSIQNWFNRKLTMPRVKHSTFDMSNNFKTSCAIGKLVPVNWEACLPSDRILQNSQEVFARMTPMLFPILHRIKVHTSNFFIPYRIILGEDMYKGFLNNEYDLVPILLAVHSTDEDNNPFINTVVDYLGYDVNLAYYEDGDENWYLTLYNPLPFLGYFLIVRDWYCDSILQEDNISYYDLMIDNYRKKVATKQTLEISLDDANPIANFNVSYSKDYFNTCRPTPQNGTQMYVLNRPMKFDPANTLTKDIYLFKNGIDGQYPPDGELSAISGTNKYKVGASSDQYKNVSYLNFADLNYINLKENTTIKDLWRKEMLQRYFEQSNTFGSRIREQLAAHWGVNFADRSIQIPEFCGGSSTFVQVTEVVQTSASDPDAENALGQLAGKGAVFNRTKSRSYYCQEHGYYMTVLSLVPDNGYCGGMPRELFKQNIFDFAAPEFNNIGWQDVYNGELYQYANESPANLKATFGYQPRYSEYRSHPSRCVGNFRTSLQRMHLNRQFSSQPVLNENFIKVNSSDTSRIFAITEDTSGKNEPILVDVFNHVIMSRPIAYEPESLHLY